MDAVATQSARSARFFARQPYEHARGMKLRTGELNRRHEKVVLASAIAHNVNNFHQVAGVGLRCAYPREKWTPIMTACRLARILAQAKAAAARRDGSKMMFHSRALRLSKSRPLRSSAKANTQCLRARVLVASSKHYWWTAKPRSPHRAPSKAVIRCRRLSSLRSSRTPKPRT